MKPLGQGGQSLAEFLLVGPLFLYLTLAILQLCLVIVAWSSAHYAAHCAARSYTVFSQRGEKLATERASHAASQALFFCRPAPKMSVEFQDIDHFDYHEAINPTFKGDGPLAFKSIVTLKYRLFLPLPGLGSSAELRAEEEVFSERSTDWDREQKKQKG